MKKGLWTFHLICRSFYVLRTELSVFSKTTSYIFSSSPNTSSQTSSISPHFPKLRVYPAVGKLIYTPNTPSPFLLSKMKFATFALDPISFLGISLHPFTFFTTSEASLFLLLIPSLSLCSGFSHVATQMSRTFPWSPVPAPNYHSIFLSPFTAKLLRVICIYSL